MKLLHASFLLYGPFSKEYLSLWKTDPTLKRSSQDAPFLLYIRFLLWKLSSFLSILFYANWKFKLTPVKFSNKSIKWQKKAMTAKSKLHWQYLQTINDDILLTYKMQGGKSHDIFKTCMAWLPCKFKKKSSTSDYHNSAVECYSCQLPRHTMFLCIFFHK